MCTDHESEPVINCYPKESIKCIDAMQSPPEVLVEVLQHLIPIRNQWLSEPSPIAALNVEFSRKRQESGAGALAA